MRAIVVRRVTQADARVDLDEALRLTRRVKPGSALAAFTRQFGGLDPDITPDKTPAEPPVLG
jgi:hypothetical protein